MSLVNIRLTPSTTTQFHVASLLTQQDPVTIDLELPKVNRLRRYFQGLRLAVLCWSGILWSGSKTKEVVPTFILELLG